MSLIAKTTISKNKKTRDVSNEGIRADVTSEVPVVKTMTWMSKLPIVKTTIVKNKRPLDVSKEGIRADILSQPLVVIATISHQSKMQPAPSRKSSEDVLMRTISMSEHLATEVICGGNVVSLSMANRPANEHRLLRTPRSLED